MIRYIKTARIQQGATTDPAVTATVTDLLKQIKDGGDEAVRQLSVKFDGLDRASYRLDEAEIKACIDGLTKQERLDLDFAQTQVRNFAQAQRATMLDLEVETVPGVILGHKHIPVANVGCYVPGGKYPLLASAHMTVLTAKVAGCQRVITCAPPFKGEIASKIVAAQALAGADEIYVLGGVQAVAAMGYGTETISPVDMLAGPGNAYVAEAKRLMFGQVGIDLFAGPTETLVIADDSVDGEIVATDLLGQAEHGANSPAVLITNSEKLAHDTLREIERILTILPTAAIAGKAWEDLGEIILCDSIDEMVSEVSLPRSALDRFPHEFSGGQRQRIAIARALSTNPELIVADEPVSALDVSVQAQVLNLMRDLQDRHNTTMLFISHDLRVVQFMCDEIGVMYLGEIVEQGPRDRIYGAPAHPYTQALLASAPGKGNGQRARLKGEIPSAHAVPSGCAFRTRCPHAFDRCITEKPAMCEIGGGQKAACHLLERAMAA